MQTFFRRHPRLKPVAADDTAGSVAELCRRGDATRAAIAGRRAAEIYGASIIRESIQDQPENFTRFVLLSLKGTRIMIVNMASTATPEEINHVIDRIRSAVFKHT